MTDLDGRDGLKGWCREAPRERQTALAELVHAFRQYRNLPQDSRSLFKDQIYAHAVQNLMGLIWLEDCCNEIAPCA